MTEEPFGGVRLHEPEQARRFGLALSLLMAALAAFSQYRGHSVRAAVLIGISLVALSGALLFLPLWTVVFRLWMKVAEKLSWLVTRLLLALFFYGVLTPFGLLRRLMGRPTLDTAFRDGRPSYWKDKPAGTYSLARYEKQY